MIRWILLLLSATVLYGICVWFQGTSYTHIVLHHSASWQDTYASIRDFHQLRGLRDAAYHLILSNGLSDIPMGHLEATGRYQRQTRSLATRNTYYNRRAIHLCVVGNYEERPLPEGMRPVLASTLLGLMDAFTIPFENILLHRDIGSTACPGKYITRQHLGQWIPLATDCPPNITAQQQQVLASAVQNSWLSFPGLALAGVVLFCGGVVLLGLKLVQGPRKHQLSAPDPPLQHRSVF